MPIEVHSVDSISEYLSIVSDLIGKWSSPDAGELKPWFRGQRREKWGLVPGEFRYGDINPDEIRSEFILKARDLLPNAPSTDWEWYFIMQHYGLPTRLLDWTNGSLVGLYFALSRDTGKDDACVWAIDPWELNRISTRRHELILSSDDVASKYLRPVYKGGPLPRRPMAIVPLYNSQRITVQRGAFTVHGSNRKGLEEQFTTRIVKVIIPKEHCIQIRRDLRNSGISEFTLFPDLDGLCRDIRAAEVEGC